MLGKCWIVALVVAAAGSGCIGNAEWKFAEHLRTGTFAMDRAELTDKPIVMTFPPAHRGCFRSPKVVNLQVATKGEGEAEGETAFENWCVIMAVEKESGDYVPIGAWRETTDGWVKVDQTYEGPLNLETAQ